jgi:hypothetical protein
MNHAITSLQSRGETLFFVLGHPGYYARAGFQSALTEKVVSSSGSFPTSTLSSATISGRPAASRLYSAESGTEFAEDSSLEGTGFEPSVLRDATDVSKTASCRLFLISRNGKVAIETPRQARTPAFSAVPKVQSGFLQRRVARTPKPGRLTIKARALAFLRQGPPLQLSMR